MLNEQKTEIPLTENDAISFYAGVDRWRSLLGARPPKGLIKAAAEGEKEERVRARAYIKGPTFFGEKIAALSSEAWGFPVWYAEVAPCIIALNPQGRNISIGCQDDAVAKALFGPDGLKVVFPKLGAEWGGRESIGGSPRGQTMTWDDALKAGEVLQSCVH